uniref:Uncharacterized protein n=1 Tax=Picea sitchensis TaxID=3332 RepID=A9NSA0_PICSI|nr:unknown [Picea sitchensis]
MYCKKSACLVLISVQFRAACENLACFAAIRVRV